jgi:hypothetical protein
MQRKRAFLVAVAAFVGLGPLIGNAAWVVLLWIGAAFQDSPAISSDAQITMWGILISLLVAGIPFAYILGVVPALVTAVLFTTLIMAVPALTLIAPSWRAAIAAMIGAITSGLAFAGRRNPEGYEEPFAAFVLAGAVAAFVVGYFWPSQKTLSANPTGDARGGGV